MIQHRERIHCVGRNGDKQEPYHWNGFNKEFLTESVQKMCVASTPNRVDNVNR